MPHLVSRRPGRNKVDQLFAMQWVLRTSEQRYLAKVRDLLPSATGMVVHHAAQRSLGQGVLERQRRDINGFGCHQAAAEPFKQFSGSPAGPAAWLSVCEA